MSLFHKKSTQQITSLDHLDQALWVVNIKGWSILLFFVLLSGAIIAWTFLGTIPLTVSGKCILLNPQGLYAIHSQVTGTVKKIPVIGGDSVKKGQTLVILEGENGTLSTVQAPIDGIITWVHLSEEEPVSKNQILISLQKNSVAEKLKVFAFLPLSSGQMVKKGMKVNIEIDTVNSSKYGYIRGVVERIMPYPISLDEYYMQKIPSLSLRNYLLGKESSKILVVITPHLNPEACSGLAWTSKKGPPHPLHPPELGSARVTLKEIKPISFVLPSWRR